MKIYYVSNRTYFTNKRDAIKESNWEYKDRMTVYGCDRWYQETVSVTECKITKEGFVKLLQDGAEWETVVRGGWRGSV